MFKLWILSFHIFCSQRSKLPNRWIYVICNDLCPSILFSKGDPVELYKTLQKDQALNNKVFKMPCHSSFKPSVLFCGTSANSTKPDQKTPELA